ncbi:MAG: 4Fe-4S binding protein, partial [Candidatus Gastranaerophilales bacterium]|nr:4Fe-4S binding protein [Candidatus Gastranaerophilales bacterium]
MTKTLAKNNCTGCGACFNICPKNAITMVQNEKGFYNPAIDQEKCINCGLCEKTCPIDKYTSKNIIEPKVFSLQNKNEEILFRCASGGAFALLANYVIQNKGSVYGVILDEKLKVCHSKATTKEELEKMYSSKYVQSDTKNTYTVAKNDLELGKTVLYSGTPCQIAGLKS